MDDRAFDDISGDTPLSRCHFYRRVCDLPAVIDPPHLGRIVMRASHVWALIMPDQLGNAVKNQLRQWDRGAGPVIAHPRSRRWTFLTRPDLPDDTAILRELFRLNVSLVEKAGTIALPSPADHGENFSRWIEPPRGIFRPAGAVVLDAIQVRAATCRTPPGDV